jgi:hypothetical protein
MMSRWLWGPALLSALVLATVLAIARPGGSGNQESLAHIITPTGTPGAPLVHLEIDADVPNGSDPCNPVDATAPAGGMHKVAVCLTSSSQPPASFTVELLYDDTLNSCTDIANSGTGLDDNPDANAGTTVWPDAAHSLGTVGWDCSGGGVKYPVCDTDVCDYDADPECDPADHTGPAHGKAFITCMCTGTGCATLPVGENVSRPIAVVTFDVLRDGIDSLSFGAVALYDETAEQILRCPGADCYGALNDKTLVTPTVTSTPTLTPTITPTPTDTSTPTPTPTCAAPVDLTGWWGYVYAMGATTYGECTVKLLQTGSALGTTTNFDCTHAKNGGLNDGTVSSCTVTGSVAFTSPLTTVYLEGTTDGSTQWGHWGSQVSKPNTYLASRATHTDGGDNVTVTFDSGGRTIDVTFHQIDAGEVAVISDSSAEGPLPGQFQLLDNLFFHVITAGTHTGPIEFCASYADANNDGTVDNTNPAIDETTLRILHYEAGSGFVDRTDFDIGKTDYDANILCAKVGSLSEFALVAPSATLGPVGGIAGLPDTAGASGQEAGVPPDNSNWSAGGDVALAGGLAAAAIAIVGGWYARRRWLR